MVIIERDQGPSLESAFAITEANNGVGLPFDDSDAARKKFLKNP
jgi:hypothetical protein